MSKTFFKTDELINSARELAMQKWNFIIENFNLDDFELAKKLKEKHPELSTLTAECSYCELYLNRQKLDKCRKCPVKIYSGKDCFNSRSVFQRYRRSRKNKLVLAKEMLEIIKNAPEIDKKDFDELFQM